MVAATLVQVRAAWSQPSERVRKGAEGEKLT